MDPHAPFKVITSKHIDHDHRNIVSLLYLPLIGAEALSLYFVFYAIIDRAQLRSVTYPHKMLYDLTDSSQRVLTEARKKLEACGLLETYKREDEYVYELFLPMSAERFIKDSPFAPYLVKQLGEDRFNELTELFKMRRIKLTDYENISTAFSDLFQPAYQSIKTRASYLEAKQPNIRVNHDFNTTLLIEGLPETLLHPSTKTRVVKERLSVIAYIYNLDEMTLKDLILRALKPDTAVDFDALTKLCQDHYRNQPKNTYVKKTSGYDLPYFKKIHPKEIIEDLTGMHVPAADLKIIEQLITKTHLKLEVISVLIAFVLRELNHQFPVYNYFEKIVGEWKRAGVEDAETAIEHIKSSRARKAERKTQATSGARRRGKELPEDIKVDWFEAYLKRQEEES